jgi:hypothetical protein
VTIMMVVCCCDLDMGTRGMFNVVNWRQDWGGGGSESSTRYHINCPRARCGHLQSLIFWTRCTGRCHHYGIMAMTLGTQQGEGAQCRQAVISKLVWSKNTERGVCPMQAGCDQQVRLDTVDKLCKIIWFHATEPEHWSRY